MCFDSMAKFGESNQHRDMRVWQFFQPVPGRESIKEQKASCLKNGEWMCTVLTMMRVPGEQRDTIPDKVSRNPHWQMWTGR